MGVAADCIYVQQHGSPENATMAILNNWNMASSLYKVWWFFFVLRIFKTAFSPKIANVQCQPRNSWSKYPWFNMSPDCRSIIPLEYWLWRRSHPEWSVISILRVAGDKVKWRGRAMAFDERVSYGHRNRRGLAWHIMSNNDYWNTGTIRVWHSCYNHWKKRVAGRCSRSWT